jgi:predicted ABC-type transport system involved in lysophospholipase L1 biosynthesis ATPase subunit
VSAPALPGALDLSALECNPTLDHILLGVDELGQITVSVPDLCHVALLGSTGGGKSNLLRLILPQLQKIGASVILADPHFAPLDPENGDDWRPIADRLIHAPAVSAARNRPGAELYA